MKTSLLYFVVHYCVQEAELIAFLPTAIDREFGFNIVFTDTSKYTMIVQYEVLFGQ